MTIYSGVACLGLVLGGLFPGLAVTSDSYSKFGISILKDPSFFEVKNVLTAEGDVGSYATPMVIVTPRGTILIFIDLRIGNANDFGNIHESICIRSEDDGRTWSEPIRIAASPDRVYLPLFAYTIQQTNTVVAVIGGDKPLRTKDGRLITEKLLLENPEALEGIEIKAPFAMISEDEGVTWQKSDKITSFGYGGCFGAGIILKYGNKKGRMIQPSRVWLDKVDDFVDTAASFKNSFNCVSYSDDNGITWLKGGLSQPCCGEACVVELSDGRIYLSNRNHSSIRGIRSYAISHDGGESFAEFGYDQELIEPVCHASMIRYNAPDQGNVILFANPASRTTRHRMTVRASMDDCKTWPVQRLIDPGKAGYSGMTVTPNGTIILVYERGEKNYRADLAVARFNLTWLFSDQQ
jgi:sialidase-1